MAQFATTLDEVLALRSENALLREALRDVLDDIENYEQTNHLSPNPPRQYCWDSVARASAVLDQQKAER